MHSGQRFRQFALLCEQWAQDESPERRNQLHDMARSWRDLADESDRFDALVRDVDETFEASRPAFDPFRVQRRSH
jgi:hypothetical protein